MPNASPLKEKGLLKALPVLLVLILSSVLYYNTLDNDLTYWDDNRYITDNPRVKDFSPSGIARIFNPYDITGDKTVSLTEFLPVTTLAHAAVYRLSGLKPFGYHLLNLSLYLVDLMLFYAFLKTSLKDAWAASLSTLTFAVLPFHVESVAWAAATKDVLSFALFMASFLLYIRYTGSSGRRALYYTASVILFAAGMLSKTFVVTLPLLLMLYDLSFTGRRLKIADKMPYFILGALLSLLYIKTNRDYAETVYLTTGIGPYRLFLTICSILREYLVMVFWPLDLNAFYYYTPEDIPSTVLRPGVVFSIILVLGALAAAVAAFIRRQKVIAFSILWFFIAFIPAMNLIPSSTLRADRYLFIPSAGFALLAGWSVRRASGLNPTLKKAVPALFALWIVFLSVLTFQRNMVWQNGITLWTDSIAKDPRNHRPYFILGNEYRHRGMTGEAIGAYVEALRINPDHLLACNNLGAMYGMKGDYHSAIDTLKKCLQIGPSTEARLNLARAYLAAGEKRLAVEELTEVLRSDPENAAARSMLGL